LLVGPRGCGKTLNVRNSYETMNKTEYSLLNINMTAWTSSNDVKETIEDKLEKRTKELYVPLTGILFFYFNILPIHIIYLNFISSKDVMLS